MHVLPHAQLQIHESGCNSSKIMSYFPLTFLTQKMLNAKAASTQEVNILKRTIADLQRELRATQHDTGSKKRRY